MGYLDGLGDYQPTGKITRLGDTVNVGNAANLERTPVDMTVQTSSPEFTITSFGKDVAALTGKVRMNSAEVQGFPSAQNVRDGQLVSDYHFNNINSLGGKFDPQTFDLKYSSANARQIASGTNYACEGVEYAEIAGHLQANENPYAELFS